MNPSDRRNYSFNQISRDEADPSSDPISRDQIPSDSVIPYQFSDQMDTVQVENDADSGEEDVEFSLENFEDMLVGDTMIGDTVCLGQIREMPEEEEEH